MAILGTPKCLFQGKSHRSKWMMTGGTPILRETPIYCGKSNWCLDSSGFFGGDGFLRRCFFDLPSVDQTCEMEHIPVVVDFPIQNLHIYKRFPSLPLLMTPEGINIGLFSIIPQSYIHYLPNYLPIILPLSFN